MNMIPNNQKTETALLGAILINPDNAYTALENLNENSFYSTNHQLIFKAMTELLKAGVNIDLITLSDYANRHKLDISISYLTNLTETLPVNYNINDYCNILKRTQYEREVFYLAEKYKEGKIEFEELTEKILDFPNLENEPDEQTLKDLFLATLKKSSEGVAYKFGLEVLNKYLGGVDHGETIVLGGYTSQGKTMMAINLATDFADKGLKVLYCTAEMTPIETARRILSKQTDTNIMDFRRGNLDDYVKTKIRQAGEALGDTWNITIKTVLYTSEIKHLILKYNPDIVFVDHLHNMDRKGNLSDYQRVTYNMRDLQSMALQNKKVIFVLSQFSRNKENGEIREPRLSDLRDSGAIEEKANIVMFVYWKRRLQGKVEPRQGGEPPEELDIIIAKNRDGSIFRTKLDFFPEYCKVKSPEYDPELMEEANQLIRERIKHGKQIYRR